MINNDKKGNQQSSGLYNKITADEAINKYKFNWVEYCKGLGYGIYRRIAVVHGGFYLANS